MRNKLITPLVLSLLMAFNAGANAADDPAARGLAIAEESARRDQGFGDSSGTLTMILKNRHGETSTRAMRGKVLEVPKDGDKSLFVFDAPADVKGTALLTFSHKVALDEQWIYLPELKRVKRIASKNKSGPFMGSEFAYEDMIAQEVEKYRYNYLRDETYKGMTCFVIERFPVDKNSGYSRLMTWIDQQEYRVQKVNFYDRKQSLLKTLTFSGYQQYLGQHWRPDMMDMINHQTGKSTRLEWSGYQFKNGFSERDFNKNSLKKAR